MQLAEVNKSEKDIYNQFIASSSAGSFLQSWEWGSWQEVLSRKIFRYWVLDDTGNKAASLQLIKMPLPLGKYFMYCPYGPIGSYKVEGYKVIKLLREKFPEAVFFRIEPKDLSLIPNPSSLTKTQNIQPGKTLILDLNKSEEQLMAEMHHKTRYNIRLAEKHGVEIKDEFYLVNGKGILAQEAVELIAKTSNRQGYRSQGEGYFRKLVDFFSIQNSKGDLKLHIYKALYKKELLASAIIVDFAKTRTYLFGGSSEHNKNLMAPYLLHWRAMLDAKNLGLSIYDFWGVETAKGNTPGFVRFKSGFSLLPEAIKQYAGAYDLVINKAWYKIYQVARWFNSFK